MIERDESPAYSCFTLTRSRMAIVFQLSSLVLTGFCLYAVLTPVIWLLSLLVACVAWFVLLKRAGVRQFRQLDHQYWSLIFEPSGQTYRVEMVKMTDHHFYAVIRFRSKKVDSLLVWRDQLPEKQWKMLKTRIKLG
ncbi:hypothetical protein [Acinetobacter sp. WZC-1]|uniref:hypothetical protein n=1 Tax=Acinetobacter sp. WZC-1 TaxID=3459034 RepID=UPI00403D6567